MNLNSRPISPEIKEAQPDNEVLGGGGGGAVALTTITEAPGE